MYNYILKSKSDSSYYIDLMELKERPEIKNKQRIAEMAMAVMEEIGGAYEPKMFKKALNYLLENMSADDYIAINKNAKNSKKDIEGRIKVFRKLISEGKSLKTPKKTPKKKDLGAEIDKVMKTRRRVMKDSDDSDEWV